MKAYVYFIKSLKNNKYYVGSTDDVNRRFQQHQDGKSKYTRNLRPLELVFTQEFDSLSKARSVEFSVKKLKSRKLLNES